MHFVKVCISDTSSDILENLAFLFILLASLSQDVSSNPSKAIVTDTAVQFMQFSIDSSICCQICYTWFLVK